MPLCKPGCNPSGNHIQESDVEIYVTTSDDEYKFLVSRLILHLFFDHHYFPQIEFVESINKSTNVEAIKVRKIESESEEEYLTWYSKNGFILVGFLPDNYQKAHVRDGFVNKLKVILSNAEGMSEEI